ncbi:MAG: 3-hydroxybutyrate dehydrogenase [Trueperaceae bacterium]|nr:3-hydroxybutyrate dehydrogenase [Trueperaceae bacterium]
MLNMTRTALITGGSSGIGKACAEALQQQGMNVAIVDINDQGDEVAKNLNGLFVKADLSKREDCKRAVETTVKAFGSLDILINNAGFQHINPIPDFPEDVWDKMIALMLTAPFLLTKYAWENLKKSGHGRIINIGSAHSLTASPYKAAYVTAKHGLLGLMRTAALEGGEFGITCNTVAPAYVRTPLVEAQIKDQARTRGISEADVEEKVFLENVAVKKLLEPQDVANYVAYLASEEAWGITGATATIDLGWTSR